MSVSFSFSQTTGCNCREKGPRWTEARKSHGGWESRLSGPQTQLCVCRPGTQTHAHTHTSFDAVTFLIPPSALCLHHPCAPRTISWWALCLWERTFCSVPICASTVGNTPPQIRTTGWTPSSETWAWRTVPTPRYSAAYSWGTSLALQQWWTVSLHDSFLRKEQKHSLKYCSPTLPKWEHGVLTITFTNVGRKYVFGCPMSQMYGWHL